MASSVAYGEALGLDPAWLTEIQKFLPPAAITIMLDIAELLPEHQRGAFSDLPALRTRLAGVTRPI